MVLRWFRNHAGCSLLLEKKKIWCPPGWVCFEYQNAYQTATSAQIWVLAVPRCADRILQSKLMSSIGKLLERCHTTFALIVNAQDELLKRMSRSREQDDGGRWWVGRASVRCKAKSEALGWISLFVHVLVFQWELQLAWFQLGWVRRAAKQLHCVKLAAVLLSCWNFLEVSGGPKGGHLGGDILKGDI